jgi:hypothetical protein
VGGTGKRGPCGDAIGDLRTNGGKRERFQGRGCKGGRWQASK